MDEPFQEHFEQLWAIAFRVAYRLRGVSAEAEDIAAEALAQALRSWPAIREPASWVATVAGRRALRRRRVPAPLRAASLGRTSDNGERIDLSRALQQLSRRQRQVVVLRHMADLSEETVAASLGVSVSAVKTHNQRALNALRVHLSRPATVNAVPHPFPEV